MTVRIYAATVVEEVKLIRQELVASLWQYTRVVSRG